MMDNILIGLKDKKATAELKGTFGFPNITYDDDFTYLVGAGIDSWQGKGWDPAGNDPTFDLFCGNITAKSNLYPDLDNRKAAVQKLLKDGGYGREVSDLTTPLLNWIGWLDAYTSSDGCTLATQDDCYSTHTPEFYQQDGIDASWRSWPYQVSTS